MIKLANKGMWEEKIIKRCWEDEAFRQKLIADPKKALESLGVILPEEFRISIHEDEPTHLHFVVPQKPVKSDLLTEEELDMVNGGGGTWGGRGSICH